MNDIIAMHRADLVNAVTEAVQPLKARIDAMEAQDEVHWKTRRTLLAERDALAAELAKNEAAYNKAAAGRNDILAGLRARVNVLESRDHCPCEDCKRARASESETTVKS